MKSYIMDKNKIIDFSNDKFVINIKKNNVGIYFNITEY